MSTIVNELYDILKDRRMSDYENIRPKRRTKRLHDPSPTPSTLAQAKAPMKSIKRMFAKQSIRKADESGSSNDPPRPSSARCRSTQRQTQSESPTNLNVPPAMSFSRGNWRSMYIDAMTISNQLRSILLANTTEMSRQLRDKDAKIEILRGTGGYRPTMNFDEDAIESTAKSLLKYLKEHWIKLASIFLKGH
ncbi:hypothetical protein LguiB_021171 [Lonicera macranthoides]